MRKPFPAHTPNEVWPEAGYGGHSGAFFSEGRARAPGRLAALRGQHPGITPDRFRLQPPARLAPSRPRTFPPRPEKGLAIRPAAGYCRPDISRKGRRE